MSFSVILLLFHTRRSGFAVPERCSTLSSHAHIQKTYRIFFLSGNDWPRRGWWKKSNFLEVHFFFWDKNKQWHVTPLIVIKIMSKHDFISTFFGSVDLTRIKSVYKVDWHRERFLFLGENVCLDWQLCRYRYLLSPLLLSSSIGSLLMRGDFSLTFLCCTDNWPF